MKSFGVTVLRVLNEKHHQKCNNRGAGIDDQLPSIGEVKSRTGEGPNHDNEDGAGKRPGTAENGRRSARKKMKCVPYRAKEITLPLVFPELLQLSLLHGFTLASHANWQVRAFD